MSNQLAAACPLAGGRWGKRGLKLLKSLLFLISFLVSSAACPLAGDRWDKIGLNTIKNNALLNFLVSVAAF